MARKQCIAKRLLAGARTAGAKPIWIGNGGRIDDVYVGEIVDDRCRQYVGDRIECLEPLVDRDLKNCGRRIG